MGCKYRKKLEVEWAGKTTTDMKIKALQMQADRNISKICSTKLCRRKK